MSGPPDDSAPPARRARAPVAVLVPALLAISLACNIAALLIPFMKMERFLGGETIYSLPRSAGMLWDAGLYAIAVLIVAFSIVFPLAKLGAMGVIWFVATPPNARDALLLWLERLGKLSFLDIFVVGVILILSSDQLLVSAAPQAGLYLFILAIALSMAAASVISVQVHKERDGEDHAEKADARGTLSRWVVPLAIPLAAVTLFGAMFFPYLRIDEFWLSNNEFTIPKSIAGLWSESHRATASLVGFTLVVAPIATILTAGVAWFVPMSARTRARWRRAQELIWQWAMLDVFALALLIFLVEGAELIKTEIRPGLYVFLLAACMINATHALVVRAIGRE